MFNDLQSVLPIIVPFALILFRVMGLFVFVPAFSNTAIPGNVKVLLAMAISICIWPIVPKPAVIPDTLIGIAIAVAGEMSVGLLIGMLSTLVVAGVQLGAHLISQQMGLSLATVYDPMFDEQSTVIEQLAFWMTIVVFFAIGGHRQLINALVYSYDRVPIGGGAGDAGLGAQYMLNVAIGGIDASFHTAIRVGGPALVAFFLSSLASGFIGRSVPQMHIMQITITANLIIGMAMLLVGFVGWSMVATEAWQDLFQTFQHVLRRQ